MPIFFPLTGGPTWSPGKVGSYALTCDGVDDRGTTAGWNMTQYSWTMWLKAATQISSSTIQQPFVNGRSPSDVDEAWGFSWSHAQAGFRQAAFHRQANGQFVAAQIPGALLRPGIWHHLAATYDGAALRMYLNGRLQATTPATAPWTTTAPLTLCGTGGYSIFRGALDEVKIFTRPLSATEIAAEYGSPVRQGRHRQTVR